MRSVSTTGDGTRYDIDQMQGLLSITDLHGNVLSFGRDGAGNVTGIVSTSKTGGSRGLTFTRGGTGNFITGITDPLGNTLTYAQSGTGDLASFTAHRWPEEASAWLRAHLPAQSSIQTRLP